MKEAYKRTCGPKPDMASMLTFSWHMISSENFRFSVSAGDPWCRKFGSLRTPQRNSVHSKIKLDEFRKPWVFGIRGTRCFGIHPTPEWSPWCRKPWVFGIPNTASSFFGIRALMGAETLAGFAMPVRASAFNTKNYKNVLNANASTGIAKPVRASASIRVSILMSVEAIAWCPLGHRHSLIYPI